MLSERTLGSVLEDPAIAEVSAQAISKRDLSKEEIYDRTLRDISENAGLRGLERGFSRLFEIASRGEYCFRLYSEEECKCDPEKENANIVYFPSDDAAANDRPFILIVPGGGLENVWNLTEGWPIAQRFNELGYNAFILTYRVDIEPAALLAVEDMARALELIKKRREAFHADPDNYITCGFSSGGYLVCLWNTEKGYSSFGFAKPRACFPVYPMTSYRLLNDEEWEERDLFARFSVGCNMDEACESCFEIPEHVEGFPPTAIYLCCDDDVVDPEHSKKLAMALSKAGIPFSIEIGATGGHGFADGTGMRMEGWTERAIDWYQNLE